MIEVGGTSTNVAAIRGGRPSLSYVRVASHATALRVVDVRVVGVAGGSMLRVRRGRVYGVGPRSAHIAGLPYACSRCRRRLRRRHASSSWLPGPATPTTTSRSRTADGDRVALTNTCAANLLGITEPGDYCYADGAAARAAFELVARAMKADAETIAQQMLIAASDEVCELALAVAASAKLESADARRRRRRRRRSGPLSSPRVLGWPLDDPDATPR